MPTDTRNLVILVGRIGKDPTSNLTHSGTPVSNLILCVEDEIHSRSGETKVRPNWIDIVCWGHLSDYAREKVWKGMLCLVIGSLESESREDDKIPGRRLYKTKVKASTLRILDTFESSHEDES